MRLEGSCPCYRNGDSYCLVCLHNPSTVWVSRNKYCCRKNCPFKTRANKSLHWGNTQVFPIWYRFFLLRVHHFFYNNITTTMNILCNIHGHMKNKGCAGEEKNTAVWSDVNISNVLHYLFDLIKKNSLLCRMQMFWYTKPPPISWHTQTHTQTHILFTWPANHTKTSCQRGVCEHDDSCETEL